MDNRFSTLRDLPRTLRSLDPVLGFRGVGVCVRTVVREHNVTCLVKKGLGQKRTDFLSTVDMGVKGGGGRKVGKKEVGS